MKETPYRVVGSWHQAVKGVQKARPAAMFQGIFVLAVLWVLAGLYQGFSPPVLIRNGIPLLIFAVMALVSAGIAKYRSRIRSRSLAAVRLNALVNMMLIVHFLLTLSGYFFIFAMGIATTSEGLPGAYPTFIVELYVVSVIAAILWAPRSLPRSKADDAAAFARSARWLPWLLGIQGSLVGIGVFLGTIAARNRDTWSLLALGGVGALGAILCVTFSILLLYRFVFLALQPIPPEVVEEFGLTN